MGTEAISQTQMPQELSVSQLSQNNQDLIAREGGEAQFNAKLTKALEDAGAKGKTPEQVAKIEESVLKKMANVVGLKNYDANDLMEMKKFCAKCVASAMQQGHALATNSSMAHTAYGDFGNPTFKSQQTPNPGFTLFAVQEAEQAQKKARSI